MKIKDFIKTCDAFPSQWEGHLEDGRMYYVRYRHGQFSVTVSKKPTKDIFKVLDEEPIINLMMETETGHMYDDQARKLMEKHGFKFPEENEGKKTM